MPTPRARFAPLLLLGGSFVLLGGSSLFACSDEDDAPAPSAEADASSNPDAGDPGAIDLDSGGRTCALSSDLEAIAACAPDAAPEGVALATEVREACGGCLGGAKRCTVTVDPDAKTIRLALDGESCTGGNDTCDDGCRQDVFRCTVPALAGGHYRVLYGKGGTNEVGLDVSDAGTSTACAIAPSP